ncbi:MAG: nitrite reductase small subunit NirD [Ignavibacteriales bacterium]
MIETDGFVSVCSINDLTENSGKRFFIDETEIALFKADGEIYALDNICPHQHAAIIYDGFIEDGCVVCPAHGWEFELKTGCLKSGSKGITRHPVLIRDEHIYVKVLKKELRW